MDAYGIITQPGPTHPNASDRAMSGMHQHIQVDSLTQQGSKFDMSGVQHEPTVVDQIMNSLPDVVGEGYFQNFKRLRNAATLLGTMPPRGGQTFVDFSPLIEPCTLGVLQPCRHENAHSVAALLLPHVFDHLASQPPDNCGRVYGTMMYLLGMQCLQHAIENPDDGLNVGTRVFFLWLSLLLIDSFHVAARTRQKHAACCLGFIILLTKHALVRSCSASMHLLQGFLEIHRCPERGSTIGTLLDTVDQFRLCNDVYKRLAWRIAQTVQTSRSSLNGSGSSMHQHQFPSAEQLMEAGATDAGKLAAKVAQKLLLGGGWPICRLSPWFVLLSRSACSSDLLRTFEELDANASVHRQFAGGAAEARQEEGTTPEDLSKGLSPQKKKPKLLQENMIRDNAHGDEVGLANVDALLLQTEGNECMRNKGTLSQHLPEGDAETMMVVDMSPPGTSKCTSQHGSIFKDAALCRLAIEGICNCRVADGSLSSDMLQHMVTLAKCKTDAALVPQDTHMSGDVPRRLAATDEDAASSANPEAAVFLPVHKGMVVWYEKKPCRLALVAIKYGTRWLHHPTGRPRHDETTALFLQPLEIADASPERVQDKQVLGVLCPSLGLFVRANPTEVVPLFCPHNTSQVAIRCSVVLNPLPPVLPFETDLLANYLSFLHCVSARHFRSMVEGGDRTVWLARKMTGPEHDMAQDILSKLSTFKPSEETIRRMRTQMTKVLCVWTQLPMEHLAGPAKNAAASFTVSRANSEE